MKVHKATWEDDPDEEIPMNIELACGMDAYAQDDLSITSNPNKVTCGRCLRCLAKKPKRKAAK